MIGRTLSHYQLLEELGRGGMGVVYLAEDTELQRQVAVKVLSSELTDREERVARFEREARAVASLNHPNILGIHDFGVSGETCFAVMEFLEGQTLRERLEGGKLARRVVHDTAVVGTDAQVPGRAAERVPCRAGRVVSRTLEAWRLNGPRFVSSLGSS